MSLCVIFLELVSHILLLTLISTDTSDTGEWSRDISDIGDMHVGVHFSSSS